MCGKHFGKNVEFRTDRNNEQLRGEISSSESNQKTEFRFRVLILSRSGDTHGYYFWHSRTAALYYDDNIYVYENAYVTIRSELEQYSELFHLKLGKGIAHWHPKHGCHDALTINHSPHKSPRLSTWNLLSMFWTLSSFFWDMPDEPSHLPGLCAARLQYTLSWGVCCRITERKRCSFLFLLDAHHRSLHLLCWTSGISEIFFCLLFLFWVWCLNPCWFTLPFVLLTSGFLAPAAFWEKKASRSRI